MSDLFDNPEDRFSNDMAHLKGVIYIYIRVEKRVGYWKLEALIYFILPGFEVGYYILYL